MKILGISAFYHDSAACLVTDGEIMAAAQEERFTRVKHDARFPLQAVNFCLAQAGLRDARELDLIAFYEKPFLKFDRLLSTYLFTAPRGIRSFLTAMPLWMEQKLWAEETIRKTLRFEGRLLFPEHHESHAASAFFPSPFAEAAVLTIDGVGEWASTTIGHGKDNHVRLLSEVRFPHSIGLLYSAFTYYLGFRVNSGEYKVMGLAPYGEPRYRDLIFSELVDLKADGSFRLNLQYFDFMAGLRMTNTRFGDLFDGPVREPDAPLTQRHMDVASSLQSATDEVLSRLARHAREVTGSPNLCLAGGVALNCVANGRILRDKTFDQLWIQPAAGDAGGALGAALLAWHHYENKPRPAPNAGDAQKASLLGPKYDIESFVDFRTTPGKELADDELFAAVAELLANGSVVGWFQGRMEFGPRALGNRSILADPREPTMQRTLNLKIKFRESFRPFAPAVLAERLSDYFELQHASPYMLLVAPVRSELRKGATDAQPRDSDFSNRLEAARSTIPAVTHVDYSARVQSVSSGDNPRFHQLLQQFEKRTGCAVLVNTSFNVRGEPPVCTPSDAMRCFMRTEIDYLVIGNFLFSKAEVAALQPSQTPMVSKPVNPAPSQREASLGALRRFGFGIAAASLLMAIVLAWSSLLAAAFAGGVALAVATMAELRPRTLRYAQAVWMIVAVWLARTASDGSLILAFYLVATPVGLLQRLVGQTELAGSFRQKASTYWQRREADADRSHYESKF